MRPRHASLLLLLLLLSLVAAASSACTLQHACDACGGRFLASQCKCTCPWSTVERSVIAHVGYVVLLIIRLV